MEDKPGVFGVTPGPGPRRAGETEKWGLLLQGSRLGQC